MTNPAPDQAPTTLTGQDHRPRGEVSRRVLLAGMAGMSATVTVHGLSGPHDAHADGSIPEPVLIPLDWDTDGISTDENPADGDFDGGGRSFPAEEFPTGRTVIGGLPFAFPESYADGETNFLACVGQVLDLEPLAYAAICVIGTAYEGNSDSTAVVTYDDGGTEEVPLQLTDWSSRPAFGESVAVQATHRHSETSSDEPPRVAVFLQTMPLDPARVATSLTLPEQETACLIAATAQPAVQGVAAWPLSAVSTDLFVGSEEHPEQLVRVELLSIGTEPATAQDPVTVAFGGEGIGSSQEVAVGELEVRGRTSAEVGVVFADGPDAEAVVPALVTTATADATVEQNVDLVVEEPGWTMFMVNHFHFDAVWWNTQAAYTETWARSDGNAGPALNLMKQFLQRADEDADYRFVLAELDYLKPYWEQHPEDRELIARLVEEGRLEFVGGSYNEPSPNLTSAELTIRNVVHGVGYQRDVLGGDPQNAWMLDVFGHDAQFPGICADAGLTSNSWARGPYHGGGPPDLHRMQFPTEFDWVSPSGRSLLTHYMPEHYSAGWDMNGAETLEEAEQQAYDVFEQLKIGAATRNCLLPVGSDFTPPNQWVTDIQRHWNQRYVSPRFVSATAKDYFDAVREDFESREQAPSPQSRDMNPVFTGKDITFIDVKQANREAENVLSAAEKFSTLAALQGARYPAEALDKAWRQLYYNAHHDAVTGTMSDQVYLDLVAGWREALELAKTAKDGAQEHLCSVINTSGVGRALVVFNPLSWERTDVCFTEVSFEEPGPTGLILRDAEGTRSPLHIDAFTRHEDGTLATARLGFLATVPGTGFTTFHLIPRGAEVSGPSWTAAEGTVIENEHYRVEVDPGRGGAITRLLDKDSGKEMIRQGGVANELLAYDEYSNFSGDGGNPWVIGQQGGPVATSADAEAEIRVETSPLGARIVVSGAFEDCRRLQEVFLWDGVARVDCTTRIDDFSATDRLLRVRFQSAVEGGLPVSETANAALGRNPGFPNVDIAESGWTLDFPAYNWFEVGSTFRLQLSSGASRAVSVGELVIPGHGYNDDARPVIDALVRRGVTATTSLGSGPRYGALDVDSNLPDLRISVGGPGENPFTERVLESADTAYAEELSRQIEVNGTARVYVPAEKPLEDVWRPGADLRPVRALPVLILAGPDEAGTREAMLALVEDIEDAPDVGIDQPDVLDGGAGVVEAYGFAVVNRGIPSFNIELGGDAYLGLLRSSTRWPAGGWTDAPRSSLADGSNFQSMHWSHVFHYSIVGHEGDWREGGVVRHGHEVNNPLDCHPTEPSRGGPLPPTSSLLSAEPSSVVITALKPRGNPIASQAGGGLDPADGVAIRAYESHGVPTEARISVLGGLSDPQRTGLLEGDGDALTVDGEQVAMPLGGFDIATVTGVPAGARPLDEDAADLAPRREAVEPIYAQYWRHNRGSAPLGYQPVAVELSGDTDADGPFELTVQVASEHTEATAEGTARLVLPDGWSAAPAEQAYSVAPGQTSTFATRIDPGDAEAGRYFAAARIDDTHGEQESVIAVDIGEHGTGAPELEVTPQQTEVRLLPGRTGQLTLELTNTARSEIRGEAQLISPYGVWQQTGPSAQGITVPGAGTATLTFELVADPLAITTGRPGAWWASVKLMYFGRLQYTDAVPFVVTDNPLAVSAEPFVLGAGGSADIELAVSNIGDEPLSGEVTVEPPPDWSTDPSSTEFGPIEPGASGASTVTVAAPGGAESGTVSVVATASAGDTSASSSVSGRLLSDRIEFAAASPEERFWLHDPGGSIAQTDLRFADDVQYWIYRLPLPADASGAHLTLTMDNQFLVEAGPDGQQWTEVLRETEPVTDASNGGDFEVDLGSHLGEDNVAYLRFGDSFPEDGNGGRLFFVVLEVQR